VGAGIKIVPKILAPGSGNQLFQLSFAHYLNQLIPDSQVYHFGIPELGIAAHPEYASIKSCEPTLRLSGQDYGLGELDISALSKSTSIISTTALGMHIKYFAGSREFLRSLISNDLMRHESKEKNFSSNNFICHIRGSDIWEKFPMSIPGKKFQMRLLLRKNLIHPDYSGLPLSFYEEIANLSGKIPIFLVERASPKWYVNLIAERFGQNSIIFSGTVARDFHMMMNAPEVALGISTFSWMAAFLGEANIVHFPMKGLFDPASRGDLDLSMPNSGLSKYIFSPHKWKGNRSDKLWLESGATQKL
jgi:hypothetical protein